MYTNSIAFNYMYSVGSIGSSGSVLFMRIYVLDKAYTKSGKLWKRRNLSCLSCLVSMNAAL